jgi:hypothetical protein
VIFLRQKQKLLPGEGIPAIQFRNQPFPGPSGKCPADHPPVAVNEGSQIRDSNGAGERCYRIAWNAVTRFEERQNYQREAFWNSEETVHQQSFYLSLFFQNEIRFGERETQDLFQAL